jgi:Auxiliary Activity family 9 (formerly GH61)
LKLVTLSQIPPYTISNIHSFQEDIPNITECLQSGQSVLLRLSPFWEAFLMSLLMASCRALSLEENSMHPLHAALIHTRTDIHHSYPGFNPSAAPYQKPPPPVIGWPNGATDTGFVLPEDYAKSNIVCHLNSSPGEKHATVVAGSTIDLQWNQWAESHHGPVIDYMAKCDGECETADKNTLEFFKISEAGLINGAPAPGTWASDTLRAQNLTWTVTVPASIAPGNYVLRHEIIALHSANNPNGAQNYPQCINLQVTGSGTVSPAGIPATKFYKETDPGIFVNIYYPALENYTIPGPPLFDGASLDSSKTSSVATVPVSSSAPESTAAAVSPKPEISSVSYATGSKLPALSLASENSTPAYEPEPTPASEAAPSAATSTASRMMTTSDYPLTSMAPEETCGTSTTTTYTTITLTTTVMAGSSPKEAALIPSPTAVLPTFNAEASSKTSETPADSSSTSVISYMSVASLMPSNSAVPSSNGTTYTPPVPSAVESAATPSASVEPADSYTDVPSGMTKQQFKQWFKEFLAKYFGKKGNSRNHPRDLAI